MNAKATVAVLVSVVTMGGAAGALSGSPAVQDRATTVLAAIRTALGGEQKLTAVRAMSAEGPWRRTAGGRTADSYVTLLVVRPGQLRRSDEQRFFGSLTERISTFDGTQAWDETVNGTSGAFGGGHGDGGGGHGGGGFGAAGDHGGWDHGHEADGHESADAANPTAGLTPEQLSQARLRRMKMELQRWTIALLTDSKEPFVDAGRAESPDGPADVLETRDEMGRPVRYFIDPMSHLPLMLQYQEVQRAPRGPQTVAVNMRLSDYKTVDGVLLPHQIDIASSGQANESWTIDAYKLNPKVKPNTFQRPTK